MRVVLQRVMKASVDVGGNDIRSIARGYLALAGIGRDDELDDIRWTARKLVSMRLFEDDRQKTNLSIGDIRGDLLVVSQFTLFASTKKGNRPSFDPAASPEQAIPLYEFFIAELRRLTDRPVVTGEFGAKMLVSLVNDGPLTILLDSKVRE